MEKEVSRCHRWEAELLDAEESLFFLCSVPLSNPVAGTERERVWGVRGQGTSSQLWALSLSSEP